LEELGYYLRSSREELGISLEELSAATRIEIHYLQAMERGDFASLPGPVYIRSYLRSYSIYVNLDPREVIRAYQQAKQQSTETQTLSRTARVQRQMELQQSRKNAVATVSRSKKQEFNQDTDKRITRSQKAVRAKSKTFGFADLYNIMLITGFVLLLIGTGIVLYLRWSTDEVANASDKVVLLTASKSNVMLG
jgi:transcriptional regulator with XRE-family HTH domain